MLHGPMRIGPPLSALGDDDPVLSGSFRFIKRFVGPGEDLFQRITQPPLGDPGAKGDDVACLPRSSGSGHRGCMVAYRNGNRRCRFDEKEQLSSQGGERFTLELVQQVFANLMEIGAGGRTA